MVAQKILPVFSTKERAVFRCQYDLAGVNVDDVKFEDGSWWLMIDVYGNICAQGRLNGPETVVGAVLLFGGLPDDPIS